MRVPAGFKDEIQSPGLLHCADLSQYSEEMGHFFSTDHLRGVGHPELLLKEIETQVEFSEILDHEKILLKFIDLEVLSAD